MTTYSFEIQFVSAIDELASAEGVRMLDAIVAAGLDDASIAQQSGCWLAIVDRDAPTFADAVLGAMEQLEQVEGCTVSRVVPQDLVSASEIARRYGRTRQWVNNLINGKRGPGDFPRPFASGGAAACWRWIDVERYLAGDPVPRESSLRAEAAFLELLNAAIELRDRSRRMSSLERDADTRRIVDAVLRDAIADSA